MSKQSGTTTVKPWSKQEPYLTFGMEQARSLYGKPLQYYPGTTIAEFTPEQLQAQQLATQKATEGSALTKAGSKELQSILGGAYVSPESNPYLAYYTQKAFEQTLPQLDTSAVQAGRYGSGAWGLQKGRAMADITSNIYGQAYETERGRQMQALQLAPAYTEQEWADISRLAGVGEERQAMEQAKINEAIARFQFGQQEPWERLANYFNLVSGGYGGVTSSNVRGK